MKKILLSLTAIVAVAAMAGVGSYAVWVDYETSGGNSITADQLDLVLANEPMNIANVYPGLVGDSRDADHDGTNDTPAMTLQNTSVTVNGDLTMTIDPAIIDYENGCAEPESNEGADPSCGAPGLGEGELQDYVNVGIAIDTDRDGTADFNVPADTLTNLALGGTVDISATTGVLPANTTWDAWLTFTVIDIGTYDPADPATQGYLQNSNVYMTDSVHFDALFVLTQNMP